jgi:hypothetical protein
MGVGSYSGGRRFLDDLPQEPLADDAELIAAGKSAEDPKSS